MTLKEKKKRNYHSWRDGERADRGEKALETLRRATVSGQGETELQQRGRGRTTEHILETVKSFYASGMVRRGGIFCQQVYIGLMITRNTRNPGFTDICSIEFGGKNLSFI